MAQATKSMNVINLLDRQCNFSFKSSSAIFERCTMPVLIYGSEIWGVKVHNTVENVNEVFYRKQLGVGTKASTHAVLAY